MQRKIDQLAEYRHRIAELAGGESLFLPTEVVAILNRMRGLGISEQRVRLERDSWILLQALDADALPQRIREKNAEFDDPETTRLYLAVDESVDWNPHDPRLDQLIDDLDTWHIRHQRPTTRSTELVASRISESSPAWQRIVNALTHRAQQRATEHDR
ncbi:hypothetical protein [Nocardia salmonicida]|uniref:hypothetical protein n=1 Tax=Nocardia salmonicida TaxID=53431 RepID=UPI0033E8448E